MNPIPYSTREASLRQAWLFVSEGRGALANTHRNTFSSLRQENGPIERLLSLLWHDNRALRQAAALALAGGDREVVYAPDYGHFSGSLLRCLLREDRAPATPVERYQAVTASLRTLVAQNSDAICGMSNMNYSFLSSALYVALLSTCRDSVEAVRRLRASEAHAELCGLLWSLARANQRGRLNNADVDALRQMTGRALAALPPNEMPEFWNHLRHRAYAKRQAVAPALNHITDRNAVPYLIAALPGQAQEVAEPILLCLGRLGDPSALPALADELHNRNRQIRRQAQAAIAAIERVLGHQAKTLLRPVLAPNSEETKTLLRSLTNSGPADPPDQLLRVFSASEAEHG